MSIYVLRKAIKKLLLFFFIGPSAQNLEAINPTPPLYSNFWLLPSRIFTLKIDESLPP